MRAKIKYLLICVVVGLLSACNKWLDVDLINQVDENKLFQKEQGFKDALAGVYNKMSSASLYGRTLSYEMLDVMAQYYSYNSMDESYQYIRDFDYKNASVKSKIALIWNDMYANISAINNILRWEEKNGQVMSEESRKQIKGEALALRAYLHFDLYRMFSEDMKYSPTAESIPYNKEFGVSLPPRYSSGQVVQLVINDLLEAMSYLEQVDPIRSEIPYQLISSGKDVRGQADKFVARMNLYAVKALLARVYITQGDKVNAAKMANEVISSEKFRLLDFEHSVDVEELKRDIRLSDEHIFSLRNKGIPDWSKSLFYGTDAENSGSPIIKLSLAEGSVLYDSNPDDVRYQFWLDLFKLQKFSENTDENGFFPKIPMIKLSEMYLILMESYYDTDRDKALELLNRYRKSRIRNAPDWFFIDREIILKEYKKDFLGEGQYWFTLKRLNKNISNNSGNSDIPASKDIYVFPLPDKEIENGFRK